MLSKWLEVSSVRFKDLERDLNTFERFGWSLAPGWSIWTSEPGLTVCIRLWGSEKPYQLPPLALMTRLTWIQRDYRRLTVEPFSLCFFMLSLYDEFLCNVSMLSRVLNSVLIRFHFPTETATCRFVNRDLYTWKCLIFACHSDLRYNGSDNRVGSLD